MESARLSGFIEKSKDSSNRSEAMRPKNLMKSATLMTLLAALAVLLLLPGSAKAQTFVYTNDNEAGPNTVTGFSVGANGALSTITGSPFLTGGTGGGNSFASNRITVCMVGAFLFVANDGSNDVSVFSINPSTGFLTLVGSPFATGGLSGFGISLGATPDNRFLFAANGGSNDISVFSIAANGALTLIPANQTSLTGQPDGTKVSPDGKFLSVALPNTNQVAMFSIGSGGTLTPVPGSPFTAKGTGEEAGLDINCASNFLFGGEGNLNSTIVDVFSIASNGVLTEISGSPFSGGTGRNSNNVLLSPDDRFLFVSNNGSNQVSVFSVAANGSLTLVTGSPFATGGITPAGMATDAAGKFLFVANSASSDVTVFSIASNGSLSTVTGSPFPTGQGSGLLSLTAFPGKSCVPNQILVDYFANANTAGAPDATVRIVNPGTTSTTSGTEAVDLCANIYVFDANQQLSECCGCSLTPNALATFSVNGNLTAKPLLGTKLSTGVIKIVSSASASPCDPTKISPKQALRAWATHIQNKVGVAFPVTEGESQAATLGRGEQADLAEDCTVLRELGSGAGICKCPPGH
jgi:hypothetical protein